MEGSRDAALPQCVATPPGGGRCPFAAVVRVGPVPLCRRHEADVLTAVGGEDVVVMPPEMAYTPPPPAAWSAVVYYVGDRDRRRIKIGTTMRPRARLLAIRKRVPSAILLAAEPGSADLERRRHDQFAHLRLSEGPEREWFARDDALMAHISLMRATHPLASLVDNLPHWYPIAPTLAARRADVA